MASEASSILAPYRRGWGRSWLLVLHMHCFHYSSSSFPEPFQCPRWTEECLRPTQWLATPSVRHTDGWSGRKGRFAFPHLFPFLLTYWIIPVAPREPRNVPEIASQLHGRLALCIQAVTQTEVGVVIQGSPVEFIGSFEFLDVPSWLIDQPHIDLDQLGLPIAQ